MTEPREPEAVEGEDARPPQVGAPASDTGAWYPVQPPTTAPVAPEPVSEEAQQVDEPTAPVPEEQPLVGEPAAAAPDVQPTDQGPAAAVPEETAWQWAKPEPAPDAEEPTQVVSGPAAEEPTQVVSEPAAEEPTQVVEQPEADEPTAVVEAPAAEGAEHIEAVEDEPVDTSSEPTTALVTEPAAEPTTAFATGQVAEPTAAFVAPEPVETSATQQLQIPQEPAAPADAIFRPASPTPYAEPTRMEPLSEEEQKLAAERAARRDARAAALAAPAPAPLVAPTPVIVHKRTNDKFWGAFGLFLLRIVLAGIFAIRGLNILTDIPATQKQFATTVLPEPGLLAIITGVAAELIALALLLGLLTRVAGLGIALIAGGALAFVYWGPSFSPFVQGQPGFLGEYELLLAAVGVLLLLIGGGGWSLDRSFRAGRDRDKREKTAADA